MSVFMKDLLSNLSIHSDLINSLLELIIVFDHGLIVRLIRIEQLSNFLPVPDHSLVGIIALDGCCQMIGL